MAYNVQIHIPDKNIYRKHNMNINPASNETDMLTDTDF